MKLRLGTRGSDLALWQAHHVKAALEGEAEVELVIISTHGDEIQDRPLQEVEGVGFFTSRLEAALAEGEIDFAVHSHKDMALASPEGLVLAAIPERGPDAELLLVHPSAHDPAAPFLPLTRRARVGTSAPRRAAQLTALRHDLEIVPLRGNVPTRVERVREHRLDAVLLAEAGVSRLELDTSDLITMLLEPRVLVPSPAQGALAIQARADDTDTVALLRRVLHHAPTAELVEAERAILALAGGGCHLALGALVSPQALPAREAAEASEPSEAPAAYRAEVFLGADLPERGMPARWARAEADTPLAASQAAWEQAVDQLPTGVGPLAPLRVVLVGGATGGTTLGQRLEQLGAEVRHEKLLSFQDVKAPELPAKLARLKQVDVIAVTSAEAARRLKGHRVPPGVTIAAVGPATAKALAAEGLRPTLVGGGGARDLAERIEVGEGGKVLFPCAESPRPDLPRALAARGITVEPLVIYRTVADAVSPESEGEGADVRVYMSPSAVSSSIAHHREATKAVRIGLGGATSDALKDESLEHEKPKGSGPEAVVHLLLGLKADGHIPRREATERLS